MTRFKVQSVAKFSGFIEICLEFKKYLDLTVNSREPNSTSSLITT